MSDDPRITEDGMRMVRATASEFRRHKGGTIDYEDLIQAGVLGLLRSAHRHREDGGANTQTFAAKAVRGEILDCLAGECLVRVRGQGGDRLYESLVLDGRSVRLGDTTADMVWGLMEDTGDLDDGLSDRVRAAICELCPVHQATILALYFESPTPTSSEIARRLKVTATTIRGYHFHALRLLREKLSQTPID